MAHEVEFRRHTGMDKTNMSVSIGNSGAVFVIHNLLNSKDERLSFKLDKNQVAVLIAALAPITIGNVEQ